MPKDCDRVASRSVGPKLRFQILHRDGFACQYCGARAPEATLQVDHVIAVSRSGSSQPDNLVAACVDCNQGKSDSLVTSVVPRFFESVRSPFARDRELGRAPGDEAGIACFYVSSLVSPAYVFVPPGHWVIFYAILAGHSLVEVLDRAVSVFSERFTSGECPDLETAVDCYAELLASFGFRDELDWSEGFAVGQPVYY